MVVFSAFALATLAVSALLAVLAAYTWRTAEGPGSSTVALLLLGATLYAGGYGANLLFLDPSVSEWFEFPFWLGGELLTVGFPLFALAFTGRGRYLTRRNVVLLALVPAATVAVVATNSYHGLMWTEYAVVETFGAGVRTFDRGPWIYVKSTYAFVVHGAAMLMFLEQADAESRRYRLQSALVIVGSLVPMSGYVYWLFNSGPYSYVDFSGVLMLVTFVCYGYLLLSLDLFEMTPAVRRVGIRTAVDRFTDAVFVLDGEANVTDLNEAAADLVDRPPVEALGTDIDRLLNGAALDLSASTQTVTLRTGAGQRAFEVTVDELADQSTDDLGYLVVFQDVTDRKRREQRLDVLNRVLRHNLRNDMSRAMGYTELVREEADDPRLEEWTAAVEEACSELVDLAEKARLFETAVDGPLERERVELAALVDDAAGDLRSRFPDATVSIVIPEGVTVDADPSVLHLAVENLLENAIEHNDAANPTVEVRLADAETDGAHVLTVRDNGPGIPDQDLRALRAGGEQPLQHGHGLGLWLVKWCVGVLGGTVSFETTDEGSTVTLRLPTVDERAEPTAAVKSA